jgi:hypothetical protein
MLMRIDGPTTTRNVRVAVDSLFLDQIARILPALRRKRYRFIIFAGRC